MHETHEEKLNFITENLDFELLSKEESGYTDDEYDWKYSVDMYVLYDEIKRLRSLLDD